jgi:hypothetical protein
MKVGDLIRFSKEYSNQPGLDYCVDWLGIVLKNTTKEFLVFWTYRPGIARGIVDYGKDKTGFEVLSES